ncbi:MAG: integrase core domain-containing protein [Akkermansia sp.]|nr:integrase core domain-containing protein [Akkermansia sp.]
MEKNGIIISQDGKGRWVDNSVMERLWRTYKYEFFFIHEPANITELQIITDKWIDYYNNKRPHATLKNQTPAEYRRGQGVSTPPIRRIFLAVFPLRHRSRRALARDAMPTLQNR